MSHIQTRMMRISTMRNLIEKAGNVGLSIDVEKFISEFNLMFGAGRRYTLEYLKDLEATGFLIIENKKIYFAKNYKIIKQMDEEAENAVRTG